MSRDRNQILRPGIRQKGFTLVEVLVASALGLLMLTLIAQTFVLQNKVYKNHDQYSAMLQGSRAAVEIITRDLKSAGYDPTGAGFDGLPIVTGQLEILADFNQDGDTGDDDEDIVYTYDQQAGVIYKNLGNGPQAFVDCVQDFQYQYLDENGNATTTPADVRQVRVSITTRTELQDPKYSENGGYRTLTLRSVVTPYNLLR